jgi:hypothetical protein
MKKPKKETKTQAVFDRLAGVIVGAMKFIAWLASLPFVALGSLAKQGVLGTIAVCYIVICASSPFVILNALEHPIEQAERIGRMGIGSYNMYRDVNKTIEQVIPDQFTNGAKRYQLGAWVGNGDVFRDKKPAFHSRVVNVLVSPLRMVVGL